MWKKAIAFVTVTSISLAMMIGCASNDEGPPEPTIWIETIDVNNKPVTCIMWDPPSYGVSMSCDWPK